MLNPIPSEITVVCAADAGVSAFVELLQEAARRMIRQKTPMWVPENLTAEKLLAQYRVDEMFVGYCKGLPAFTCALQEWDDAFWGEGSGNADALYIHKIAVADAFIRQGMVYKMFAFAEAEARRQGKSKLRLDCRIDRTKVRAIYDRYGFRDVGEKKLFGWYHGISYEYILPNATQSFTEDSSACGLRIEPSGGE